MNAGRAARSFAVAVLSVTAVAGCAREAPPPPASAAAEAAPAAAPAPKPPVPGAQPPDAAANPAAVVATFGAGPFPAFGTLDDVAARWQGAWVIEVSPGAPRQVWDVRGKEVTTSDATGKATVRQFTPLSPCTVEIATVGPTGRSASILPFAFEGTALYVGLGDAGVRKGGSYLLCSGGLAFTLKDGACVAWQPDASDAKLWTPKSTRCTVRQDGGQDEVEVFDPREQDAAKAAQGKTARTYGDALMNEQMRAHPAIRVDSVEQGRAMLLGK